MDVASEMTIQCPKRRHGRRALWLGLCVVLAICVCRWSWQQVMFVTLQEPLIQAVRANDTIRVHSLLHQGADPNTRVGYHPETFWERIRRWLRRGHRVDTSTSILMEAVDHRNAEMVRLLLEQGANVNQPGGHLPIDAVLKPGNVVFIPTVTGGTALHHAAYHDAVDCLQLLIEKGATINARDTSGLTPLYWAVKGMGEGPCIRILLERGANPNVQDGDGNTPLLLDAGLPYMAHTSHTRLLLKYGANVNAHDNQGTTALMSAASHLALGSVQALLQQGADVNAKDKEGETALWMAVYGALQGWPALGFKEYQDRYNAVLQALLDRGADPGLKNAKGVILLQTLESSESPESSPWLEMTQVHLRKAVFSTSRSGKAGH